MKKTLILCFLIILFFQGFAQSESKKEMLYNPNADAKAELNQAIVKAEKENKHVLIQVGGNWCKWCIRFYKFITTDMQLDSMVKANYVFLKLNYSKENKNFDLLKQFEFPHRFGFPVFVILDSKGKRIHTQNSAYLEDGDGYSKEKVMEFLKGWTHAALNPSNYKE